MLQRPDYKKYLTNDYLSTAIILLSIVGLIFYTGTLSRIDHLIFDIGQKMHYSPAPKDVVIVAIDEESLLQLGRWPWSRKIHADLVKRVNQAGAKVIGLDIVFSEPESKDADAALAAAITQAKNVVLPVLIEETRANGQFVETLPLPELMQGAADLGRTHVALDEDGIARSIYLYEGVGAPVWQHFSQAILNVAQQQATKNNFTLNQPLGHKKTANIFSLVRENQQRISFIGPAGHFSTISYAQVYQGKFPQDLFNNKIVLVGATASGMSDLLSTPVSGLGQPMAGVEVHANILQSMRNHNLISMQAHQVEIVVLALLALLPLLWLPKLSALKGLVATLFFFMMVTFIAALLPQLLGIWIAPSAALLAILIAFPIWSWRKLEAATRYLDVELAYLRHNLNLTSTDKFSGAPVANYVHNFDSFDARIAQVKSASEQLRFLQEDRKETLAFISHDLRAPLARALMIVEANAPLKDKLYAPLSQAIDLAEDFLQTSRAEMINTTSFKELDFAGLTHQAVDEAFEAAVKKNITFVREIAEGQVWLHGNFGLLQRAILNLLLNAIKFSPEHTVINIQLRIKNQQATLVITNLGEGISEEEQVHLFKRFSRLQSGQTIKSGAGLGLYFVQTVAEKHQGSIEVVSQLGQSTSFILRLPMAA